MFRQTLANVDRLSKLILSQTSQGKVLCAILQTHTVKRVATLPCEKCPRPTLIEHLPCFPVPVIVADHPRNNWNFRIRQGQGASVGYYSIVLLHYVKFYGLFIIF